MLEFVMIDAVETAGSLFQLIRKMKDSLEANHTIFAFAVQRPFTTKLLQLVSF